MEFLALQPFVPSGNKYEESKELFKALGFTMQWDGGGYAGFSNGPCRFILQHYDKREFAENFMLTVNVPDVREFYNDLLKRNIPGQFGIRVTTPQQQPYGLEVNLIDLAGVCWHFVQG
jgi:hypothetical protein